MRFPNQNQTKSSNLCRVQSITFRVNASKWVESLIFSPLLATCLELCVHNDHFLKLLKNQNFASSAPNSTSASSGRVITSKAAVAWEAGKPLVIEKVEVAPPQANEVKGQTPFFPRIFDHEAAGVVESVGDGAIKNLKPGDHVLPVFTGECGDCVHCKSEESNMCDLLRINTDRGVMIGDGKQRFSKNGTPINHFLGTSTFSDYTVIHEGCLAKIDLSAPLDKVCILSCGVSTGFCATLKVAKPKKGSSVAVFGLGAVSLAAAEGARISGASRIIGVDLNPKRFEEAKNFGVNEFVNPRDHIKPVQQIIAEMTNGGVDRSLECTGNINSIISAFECVHDACCFSDNSRNLFGNYKPRTDLPSVVDMYMNKKLEVEKFITHRVPFSEINKACDYMLKGEGLRCIISMEE
ncbi:hypothetical protein PRUPE_8G207200 [Prunus persica]|uniref:Enoyl reductase (ER) domain-containing protein n=1 Tax=Prunus persica TaxID=3760 RepID=A0A251N351_PRUPE|nr:hypothetical protein PRUPE_8G207200 [Prunus persica]